MYYDQNDRLKFGKRLSMLVCALLCITLICTTFHAFLVSLEYDVLVIVAGGVMVCLLLLSAAPLVYIILRANSEARREAAEQLAELAHQIKQDRQRQSAPKMMYIPAMVQPHIQQPQQYSAPAAMIEEPRRSFTVVGGGKLD